MSNTSLKLQKCNIRRKKFKCGDRIEQQKWRIQSIAANVAMLDARNDVATICRRSTAKSRTSAVQRQLRAAILRKSSYQLNMYKIDVLQKYKMDIYVNSYYQIGVGLYMCSVLGFGGVHSSMTNSWRRQRFGFIVHRSADSHASGVMIAWSLASSDFVAYTMSQITRHI